MKKIILLIMLCLLTGFATASAEKQEWCDKNFNFSKVKMAYIYDVNFPDKLKNGIAEKETMEIFYQKAKLDNVKIFSTKDIVARYKNVYGIDLVQLFQENQKEALVLLNKAASEWADITILASVLDYGARLDYEEGHSYSVPNNQTSYVYGPRGTAVVQTQSSETRYAPGGYVPVFCTTVKYEVFNSKNYSPVMTRIDVKEHTPGLFNRSKTKELYTHSVENFFEDLSAKINNK